MTQYTESYIASLPQVRWSDQLVVTSAQLAEFYGCTVDNIKVNFNRNRNRFAEGTHYFRLEGDALEKLRVTLKDLRVSDNYLQISPMTRTLYLWTKPGTFRHAKMINTDQAWDVFELLEAAYFDKLHVEQQPPRDGLSVEKQINYLLKMARSARDPYLKDSLVKQAAALLS